MGLASISVDLDSLHHYCRIHALPESLLDDRARGLVYQVAIARFLDAFDRAGVRATFFAIGEDLADVAAAKVLRQARERGIEVGNHSQSHDYALTRRTEEEIADEVRHGAEAISSAVGERPVGFRAPGYTLNGALYRALAADGYRYDSSTFPAVPYYSAKALVMGALALGGRPSRAILDSPSVLLAPTRPYAPDPDAPYRRGSGTVLELPIATVPGLRIPFIGTFATSFPAAVVNACYRALRGVTHFNFELHGIDVLDASDGIPEALVRRQRDAAIPAARKVERLGELFRRMRDDFEVLTLAEASSRLPTA